MSGDFKQDAWTANSNTLGGRWNWDYSRPEFLAGLSASNFTVTAAQLLEIDAKLDDGDFSTELPRKIARNRASHMLEP